MALEVLVHVRAVEILDDLLQMSDDVKAIHRGGCNDPFGENWSASLALDSCFVPVTS
jgi:hypothetical protein